MLSTADVSLIMSDTQIDLIKKLERDIYFFPTLVIMHTEGMLSVEEFLNEYTCIVGTEYIAKNKYAYTTRVSLRITCAQEDLTVQELIRELVYLYQPDAIGYIAQCLYKSEGYRSTSTEELNRDPETIRVIHNCFFVKGDKARGYLMATPYIIKEPKKKVFDLEDKNFIVSTFFRSWEIATKHYDTRIPNPYNYLKKDT
jgi:hypothetical protein